MKTENQSVGLSWGGFGPSARDEGFRGAGFGTSGFRRDGFGLLWALVGRDSNFLLKGFRFCVVREDSGLGWAGAGLTWSRAGGWKTCGLGLGGSSCGFGLGKSNQTHHKPFLLM